LTKDELKVLLTGLGKDVDVASFLNSVDVNNDGKLDFHEFLTAASAGHFNKKLTKEQVEKLKEQFNSADVNKDGFLTKDELKVLLAGLGKDVDVGSFLNSVDINNDGKLDFNEFISASSAGHFDKKLTSE